MSETGFAFAIGIASLLAVAIYVFAWRASSGATTLIKALARVGLPLLVLVPLAAAVLLPQFQQAKTMAQPEPPSRFDFGIDKQKPKPKKTTSRNRKTAKAVAEKVRKDEEERKQSESAEEDRARVGAEEEAMAKFERDAMGGASGETGGAAEDVAASEPAPGAPAVAAAKPQPTAPPQDPSAARGLAPPAASSPDWDMVPVFYGTDRKRADNASRLDYEGDRGRRLELGHALVSVPKSHQVPNIERPWALRIPYFDVTIYEEAEDPKKHFVMHKIKALERGDFLDLVRQRLATSTTFKDQAFVFVHGFNTSFANGVYRTAQIAYDLKFDGAPFLYSWPSGGGVASYTYDRESSGQSTPYMRDFMKLVINETGAKAVSVIAHSMGNQPVLQVLKDLKNSAPDDVVISQVILAAPDVDRDNFENIAKEILGLAKGITLYVAANDQALQVSRRFHGGVPRAGDVPSTGPLIINGIDTIDVTAASTDSLGINHSGYAENNALLKDIERLIATGAPPADRQPPKFLRVEHGTGAYWRYPGAE